MSKVTELKWNVPVGADPTKGLTSGNLQSEWAHHPLPFVGYDLEWTGTTAGAITVDLSDDGTTVTQTIAAAAFSPALTNPAGGASASRGQHYTTASYSRVNFTRSGGTGQLTGRVTSKNTILDSVALPVSLTNGGTGATTAAGARTSLHVGKLDINAQTGTTYAPVTADVGRLTTLSNASAITVTLPTPTSIGVEAGETVPFIKEGAGDVTFVAGAGATVNSPESCLRQITQFSMVFATAKSTTLWNLSGALVA